ncbi:helix-turn-helix transcriptional regulator [Rummeliibacillus stabekisii]|uniref:HTH cro/C1-type domain-containing protein n=1 Tax=Rummeliibacillus stabekisii TaxID=241244 RepID=A0A143HCX2_9BACL|nr:helix-turn-helix transcriptional regulator [Rummeliibacillus stabekisii]AMW99336.1 hypothetical protein ATY39_07575 [Rummeliibacillus stabekisii]
MRKEVTFPKLRGAIASMGISQKGLVSLMEEKGLVITPSSLSNKINGERDFKRTEMQVISEILGESPVDLFFNVEYTNCVLKEMKSKTA